MKIFIGGGVKAKPILQKEWAFLFFAPDDLRFMIYGRGLTPCSMLFALCNMQALA